MSRPAIAIALPPDEYAPVSAELTEAGLAAVEIRRPADLEAALSSRRDIALAIIDGENDFDRSLEMYEILHEGGRDIPALMVVSARALERLVNAPVSASLHDEYVTRPYSAESLRWRVEAMLIRAQTVDDGSGPIIQSGPIEAADWARRATTVVVFNPKGGVGKTTVAVNLGAALQVRRSQRVLLIDADTVTGHVASSLGLDQVRSVVDSWRDEADDGLREGLLEIASAHSSGMQVVTLTSTPLHTEVLTAQRVIEAIGAVRRSFDFIIIDTHPSYGPLNLALFEHADRILVPLTPDLPALRAAVQFRDVAAELGIQDRISMIVNRANSGVSVADIERTVGIPALAQIRSAGMLFVRAANEGRTVIERFPREKVTEDFDRLADRLLPTARDTATQSRPVVRGLFGRREVPAGV